MSDALKFIKTTCTFGRNDKECWVTRELTPPFVLYIQYDGEFHQVKFCHKRGIALAYNESWGDYMTSLITIEEQDERTKLSRRGISLNENATVTLYWIPPSFSPPMLIE